MLMMHGALAPRNLFQRGIEGEKNNFSINEFEHVIFYYKLKWFHISISNISEVNIDIFPEIYRDRYDP